MLSQAKEWQQSAEQYELVIAGFLRAHAVASSAKANFLDLLQSVSAGADEKVLALLARTEQRTRAFYAQPGPGTQQEFEQATRALQGANLNPQRLEELQLQVRLLLENVSIPSM